jgi:uncharacterized protein
MHAAALRFDLYLRECRSLKTKRSVVKPVTDGLRRRHHLSVAEVGHQDSWQRAVIGVAAVASTHAHLLEILAEAERFVWSFPEVDVLEVQTRWLEEE